MAPPHANTPSRETPPLPSRSAGRVGIATAIGAPYSITRHFSVTSLIGILVVLGVLLLFYRYTAFNAIKEHEARNNVAITQVFANTLWPAHASYISRAMPSQRRAATSSADAAASSFAPTPIGARARESGWVT